MKDVQN